VLTAKKVPLKRTRNIEIELGEWKVLYYYHDKEDEIHEFPYYEYEVKVPMTSMLEIEKLEIFVDNETKKDISLGVFHPSERIEVLDFVGYFEARKLITKKIPLRKTISPLHNLIAPKAGMVSISRPQPSPSASNLITSSNKQASFRSAGIPRVSRNKHRSTKSSHFRNSSSIVKTPVIGNLPSMKLNTRARKIEAHVSNSRINNTISRVVETGTLKYRIDIHYKDGRTSTKSFTVPIASRPKLPPESPANLSISIGNKTFRKSTVQLPSSAAAAVQAAVSQISMSKNPQLSQSKQSSTAGISRAKTFGGFKK
jgi:hypothetical protein